MVPSGKHRKSEKAMENFQMAHLQGIYLLKMVMFHSYVSLLKGN